jgi:peptidyl-prolyl cis-trans isomerase B (cyclophilin B)
MKRTITLILTLILASTLNYAQEDKQAETMFTIKTEYGNIICKLYNDTPMHRDNFIKLVNEGWYESSNFHRIIKGFMVQGGHNAEGKADPGYTIPAEFRPNHFHKRGVIAAARLGDQVNPQKNSSGCQFYIVQGRRYSAKEMESIQARTGYPYSQEQIEVYGAVGGAPHLDGAYTVYGEVISGMDIVDQIANVPTIKPGDKPEQEIEFSIEIIE